MALSTEASMLLRLAAGSPLEVEVVVHAVARTARSPHARKERLSMSHSPVVVGQVIVRVGSVSLKIAMRQGAIVAIGLDISQERSRPHVLVPPLRTVRHRTAGPLPRSIPVAGGGRAVRARPHRAVGA